MLGGNFKKFVCMFGGLYSPSAVLAVLVWTRDNSGTTWGQLTMRGSVVSALICPGSVSSGHSFISAQLATSCPLPLALLCRVMKKIVKRTG